MDIALVWLHVDSRFLLEDVLLDFPEMSEDSVGKHSVPFLAHSCLEGESLPGMDQHLVSLQNKLPCCLECTSMFDTC